MEQSLQIGRWRLRFDAALTADLYAKVPERNCDCTDCVNFRGAGDAAFSPPFLFLLRQLGIDRSKPAELCHYGTSGEPIPTDGWFHFIGMIEDGEDAWRKTGPDAYVLASERFPGMQSVGFTARLALVPEPFQGRQVVQLEFGTVVPWVTGVPLA